MYYIKYFVDFAPPGVPRGQFYAKTLDKIAYVCYNGSISLKTYVLYQAVLEYFSILVTYMSF